MMIQGFQTFQNQSDIKRAIKSASQSFLKAQTMAKYTKVYVRNKKQSNISLPLRFSLLRSIFVQNMSVKNAAAKWKVHYSSAKIIARTARRNKLYYMFEKDDTVPHPIIECSYREIDPQLKVKANSDEVKINQQEQDQEHSKGAESITDFSLLQWSKIEICSSIGWTYPTLGIPSA